MSYTREEIEQNIEAFEKAGACFDADMLRHLLTENDALREDAERWEYARTIISEAEIREAAEGDRLGLNRGRFASHSDESIDAARK